MKRLLTLVLAIVMALSLAACGGKTDSNTTDNNPNSSSSTDNETPPTTVDDGSGAGQDVIPENAIQLYDGSYLDLDGEYTSGTPCKLLGGTTLDVSRAIATVAVWMPQEDGSVDEDFRLDMDISDPSVFANIPAGVESYRVNFMPLAGYLSMDEFLATFESKVYDPGTSGYIDGAESYYIRWENDTDEPATAWESHPYMYSIYYVGENSRWLDGQPVNTLDDAIGIYGDPAGVYARSKNNVTYIWKFTGNVDAYLFLDIDSDNTTVVEIHLARECEALRAYCEELDPEWYDEAMWYDVLEELGL